MTPKTKKSRRTVPLIETLLDALRTHKTLQARDRLAAGKRWVDTSDIFTTEIGTAIEPDNLLESGTRCGRRSGWGRCASTICGTRV